MTVALIFLLVLLVLALLIVPFARDMVKDRLEFQEQTLDKKFEVLIEHLNQGLMFGDAHVTTFDNDPRSLNIFSDAHANRIIHFMYSTGHLTIEMCYKYFQKELCFSHQYYNLRNITIFDQKNIARDFIERAKIKIAQHEAIVNGTTLRNIDSSASSPSGVSIDKDPTKLLDDFHSDLTKEQKMALVNHMVIIDQVTRKNPASSYKIPLVQQSMMMMNISEAECAQQLSTKSEDYILGLLKSINSAHLDLHVCNCMMVTAQFAKSESDAEVREAKLWSTFNTMGISQEEAQKMAAKIMALGKMFGI
jgi:hypothetical protein